MKRSYAIFLPLFLGLVVLIWVVAGGISFYVDLASAAVVIFVPLPLLFSSFSFSEVGSAFLVAFGRDADGKRLRRALEVFTTLERLILLSGFLGLLCGIIAILANVSEAIMIGKGLSLALITVLYSVILMMGFTVPVRGSIRGRLADLD